MELLKGECKKEALNCIKNKYDKFDYTFFKYNLDLGLVTGIWGYLLEYFDSLKTRILIYHNHILGWSFNMYRRQLGFREEENFDTRQEAQIAAIKSACEIRNKELNSKD